MLVAAPGTKEAEAAPVEEPPAEEVSAAPPKPVTGMREVVAAVPVAEAEEEAELDVALPLKGV